MAGTITWKTKGKAKERPKDAQPPGTKEGRELVPRLYWVKKNPIKTDGWNHHVEDKRESQIKAQKKRSPREPKKGKS
jgi:hypothetical protein